MDAGRFDALTRGMAARGGRRGLLGRLVAGTTSVLILPHAAAAQPHPAAPCRFVGITGGGVVRLPTGDANFVLFASRLVSGETPPTNGVVRWQDPNHEGGLLLESVGPLVYRPVEGDETAREVSGLCRINGEFEQPFVLVVADVGARAGARDHCRLTAGDRTAGGAGTGWGYEAAGDLVGGDLVLIKDEAAGAS